ncbi:hypothetical protein BpHYR1_017021 [Brachionus plicatilis]|uniref:Uncharacterized protein n=1 Tax=Brachionus plicatilis TaxID=10195 RepID=A0A3M7RPT0_BRAPC|nr:hypothetical protein BpHYR1_017021 [Brachionus plicatilis]
MLNIKRFDHIPLESIYKKNKYKEFNRLPLMENICSRQLGWLGHALRMGSKEEPARIFTLYEPEMVKKGGAPRSSHTNVKYLRCLQAVQTNSQMRNLLIYFLEKFDH